MGRSNILSISQKDSLIAKARRRVLFIFLYQSNTRLLERYERCIMYDKIIICTTNRNSVGYHNNSNNNNSTHNLTKYYSKMNEPEVLFRFIKTVYFYNYDYNRQITSCV